MSTTRKCSICGVVNIQSDRLRCSRCATSPLDDAESKDIIEEEGPDKYYEIYRKTKHEVYDSFVDEEED